MAKKTGNEVAPLFEAVLRPLTAQDRRIWLMNMSRFQDHCFRMTDVLFARANFFSEVGAHMTQIPDFADAGFQPPPGETR